MLLQRKKPRKHEKKIRVAAIKFALGADGGTEKFLQTILANLPKDEFEVDAYYTNAAPYVNSDYKHADNNPKNLEYLKENGINLIPVHVDFKDVTNPIHPWVGTNFFELFDEDKYDIVTRAIAGHDEYPGTLIKNPWMIDIVTLPNMAHSKENIYKVIHISEFQKQTWVNAGGPESKAVVIPLISELPLKTTESLRAELKISKESFVFGFHQRDSDGIFSPISLEAYKKVMNENTYFIIMGGSTLYLEYAKANNLTNFIQLPHSGDPKQLDRFLNTLNVLAHARKDGETFGLSIAEAMSYGLPVVSHHAPAVGHIETIGDGGIVCESLEQYSDFLHKLMTDNETYLKYSKASTERFNEKLSLKTNIEKIVKIFKEAANTKRPHQMSDEEFWEGV